MFYKPYSIDTNQIILKKPITPNFYPIKYGSNTTCNTTSNTTSNTTYNIVIQTPLMYIPFGISKFNTSSYIEASFKNPTNDPTIDDFYTFICSINHYFISLKKFKKYTFVNSLKKPHDFFPHTLKLKYNDDILIYNEDNIDITNTNGIKPKLYSKFIIQPTNVWVNHKDKKYGLIWTICQIKLFNNLVFKPKTFAFIDEDVITNKIKYEKYFKMLQRGVPLFAVKQKLILDKLDPTIIDNPNDSCSNSYDIKPKEKVLSIPTNKNLLGDIKTNPFSLKKTTINNNKNINNKPHLKPHNSLLIPSQKDIVLAMKNLKKIVI